MSRSKLPALLAVAALVPLVALAIWFRVSSLAMPAPNGDEAFFAVQGVKVLRGEGMKATTPSGNLTNLLVVGSGMPLYLAMGPSPYVIKIPAATAGILAVLAAGLLWGRALDRATGLIGAGLLAVLPVALAECRIGAEAAWNPLVGVIALAAAFRGHRLGLALAFLLCYHVHPTYLFLLPVYGLVLLTKLLQRTSDDPTARWRSLAITTWGTLAVLAPLVYFTQGRSTIQWTYEHYGFGPCDWPLYFLRFERLLMGFCEVGPYETTPGFDRAFWVVFGTILVGGTICLFRQRQWDRLALIGGLLLSLCGLHLVTGPDILRPYFVRYGLFLVAPTVLATACCLKALLVWPVGHWQTVAHRVQVASLIGLAWILLMCFKVHYLDHLMRGHQGQESLWTLRTEAVDPKQWAAKLVARDVDQGRKQGLPVPDRAPVLGEDWWTYRPLQFYLSHRPDLETASLEFFDGPQRDELITRHLHAGGYVVGTPGKDVMLRVEGLFPPEALTHWHLHSPPYEVIAVYRLKRPEEPREAQPVVVRQPPGVKAETVVR